MEILHADKSYKDSCASIFFQKKKKKSRTTKPFTRSSSFINLYKKKYHSARRRFIKNLAKYDTDLIEYDVNANPYNKKDRPNGDIIDRLIHTTRTFKKKDFMYKLEYNKEKKCDLPDDKILLRKKQNNERIAKNRATQNSNYCDLYFSPHNIITKFILNDFFVEDINYISYANALKFESIRINNVLFDDLVFRLIRCYFTEKTEYEYINFNHFEDCLKYMKNMPRASYDRVIFSVHISILNKKHIVLQKSNIEKSYIKLADVTMVHFFDAFKKMELNKKYNMFTDIKYYYITNRQNVIRLKYDDMFNIYRIIKNDNIDNMYIYDQLKDAKTTIISGKIEEKNSLYDDDDDDDYNICKILSSIKY